MSLTLIAFLATSIPVDLALAARTPLELASVSPNRAGGQGLFKELNVKTFTLPEYLGHIKDSYSTSDSKLQAPSSQLIIHIQDAHCNYAAQKRIAEILQYLNQEYNAGIINLEGGAGDYDLSIFTRIPDKTVREKVADNFVKEGLVSGAEYFAINNPEKATLWGIEDTKLYIENLNVYRESLKYKEEVDKELKALNHILSNLKTRIYSKELFELDLKYGAYKGGNLEFKEYLMYLFTKARERGINIKSYTNVYLLDQALEQEVKIDFKKANNERDSLIDRLQKRLSKNAVEELILKTLEFKTEKISQRDFYNYVVKKARSMNIGLEYFPELQKYIVYISMYAAIDKSKVIEEVDSLENTIKGSIYRNEEEKALSGLSKNLALLKNIFNVSLTRDDYKYYQANKSSFDMKNYAAFIDKYASRYNISATLDKDIEKIDRSRDNITSFYEYSLKRDEAFLKNLRFKSPQPKAQSPKLSILVTGGFHTENLSELFKKNNISYVSIMPNFKNDDGYECPYFRLLAGELTGIEKRLYSALSSLHASTIAAPPILSPQITERVWSREDIGRLEALVAPFQAPRASASGKQVEIIEPEVAILASLLKGEPQEIKAAIERLLSFSSGPADLTSQEMPIIEQADIDNIANLATKGIKIIDDKGILASLTHGRVKNNGVEKGILVMAAIARLAAKRTADEACYIMHTYPTWIHTVWDTQDPRELARELEKGSIPLIVWRPITAAETPQQVSESRTSAPRPEGLGTKPTNQDRRSANQDRRSASGMKALAEAQVRTAKAVIADFTRNTADIIVMPGSDIYLPQITAVSRETSRKLHKDYGQETVPYSYKYGDGWLENLKNEILPKAVSELRDRITRGDITARAIIFVPAESIDAVKEIIGKEYAEETNAISVVGEADIPKDGVIDIVMHIVLGKGLLNYGRYGKDFTPEAKINLAEFIKTLISNPEAIDLKQDPLIIDKILKGLVHIKIRPIDFRDIEIWKKAQDEVLRSL